MSIKVTDEIFLLLHCEKNSDGTKNLVLKGNDLILRVKERIWDSKILKICFFLQNFKQISSLNLSYNNITDQGFMTLVEYYLVLENNLKHLYLIQCDITEIGIKYMCDNVKELKLIDLRLNGNKFGSKGGQHLALYLNDNKYLEFLDIGETDQTLSSTAYFMQILNNEQGLNKTIKVFNISRIIPCFNRYNYNDQHLAESISYLLRSNKTLVELHLQKCQLDGHDIEEIVEGLQNNKTLLFLDIGYNKISDHGIEVIANYLKNHPPLLGLNVAGNGIKDSGARVLSFYMPYSRIRLLDLSQNNISPIGIKNILNSIKKPVKIRILNLWGNTFDHNCNVIIKRMYKSGALNQNYVDVKIYEVDDKCCAAYNPSDRCIHKYYCELDYFTAVTLKIKKNIVPKKEKNKVDFKFYPTIPGYKPIKRKKHGWKCMCCRCSY